MMLTLAKISIPMHIFMWIWILVAVALILIVLLQKGRGGGVGAAFGGMGASSLMGSKTGDFLTWITITLVALFLVMAILMGKFLRPTDEGLLGPAASATAGQALPQQPDNTAEDAVPAQPDESRPEQAAAESTVNTQPAEDAVPQETDVQPTE